MPSPRIENFLDQVLRRIKFPFDRNDIRTELENHLSDRVEYYIEQGSDSEQAEQQAIEAMGDANEIGKALNKVHNPILGWTWKLTNVAIILLTALILYIYGFSIINTISNLNIVNKIPKSDVVYRIDLKKTIKIDDTVLWFTNIVYDKEGNMNIFYRSFDTSVLRAGNNTFDIQGITDNLGNKYMSGSGYGSSGLIYIGWWTVNHFSADADTLILTYDRYNRSYKVEIPLKVGGKRE